MRASAYRSPARTKQTSIQVGESLILLLAVELLFFLWRAPSRE